MTLAPAPHEPCTAPANSRQQAAPLRRRCWLASGSSSQSYDPTRSRWPGQPAQHHARRVHVPAGTLSNSSCSPSVPAIITLPVSSHDLPTHECSTARAPVHCGDSLQHGLQPQYHVMTHEAAPHHSLPTDLQWCLSPQSNHTGAAILAAGLTAATSQGHHGTTSPQQEQQQCQLRTQQQSESGSERTGGRRLEGGDIMCIIKQQRTLQELQSVLYRFHQQFNKLHVSAACTHAAQLVSRAQAAGHSVRVPAVTLKLLLQLQLQHLHGFGGRQVANSLWALSKLLPATLLSSTATSSQHGEPVLHQLQQQVLEGLLQQLPGTLDAMQPQEVANTWYAIAGLQPYHQVSHDLLHQLMHACQSHWHERGFKPQELVSLLWASAGLLAGASTSSSITINTATVQRWLGQLMEAHKHVLHKLTAAELSTTLWAVAQLWHLLPEASSCSDSKQSARPATQSGSTVFNHHTGEQPQQQHAMQHRVQPQQQANSTPEGRAQQQQQQQPWLVSESDLHIARLLPSHWMYSTHLGSSTAACAWVQEVCQCLQQCHQQLGCAELVAVLSGLRRLPPHPTQLALTCSLLRHAQHQAQHGRLTTRAAACVLSAAVALQLQPSPGVHRWAADIVQHALVSCGTCSVRDVSMTLYALARLKCRPTARTAQQLLQHAQQHMAQGAKPTQVALLLWVCAHLNLLPPTSFLVVFQKTSYSTAQHMPPSNIAALFWALGRLRVHLGLKWCDNALACIWKRRAEFHIEELLQVLASVGRMQYPLSTDMSELMVAELQHRCSKSTAPQQLVATVSALARLRTVPPSALAWAAQVLVGELLQPCISQLRPADLVSMMWAYAQVLRRLRTVLPPVPKRQYSAVQHGGSIDEADDGILQELPPSHARPWLDAVRRGSGAVITSQAEHGWKATHSTHQPSTVDGSQAVQPIQAVNGVHAADSMHAGTAADAMHAAAAAADSGIGHIPADASTGSWIYMRREAIALYPDVISSALQRAAQLEQQLTAQQLAVMLYALTLTGVQPSTAWLQQLLFSKPQLLTQFNNHELALAVFSLGCMGSSVPVGWMQACLSEMLMRAPAMNTGAVSGVLRGLSLLDFNPGPAWLSAFVSCVSSVLALMPEKQLSKVYAAVVDLDPQLANDWGHNFHNLLHAEQ